MRRCTNSRFHTHIICFPPKGICLLNSCNSWLLLGQRICSTLDREDLNCFRIFHQRNASLAIRPETE